MSETKKAVPSVEVRERSNHVRIEIQKSDGEHFFTIEVTDKGMVLTGDMMQGDFIIKPKTGNQVAITFVDSLPF